MKSETALIRIDCTVERNAVSGIDVNLTVIIDPRHTELDLPFRIDQTFQQRIASELWLIGINNRTERIKNFLDCLMEFRLIGIFFYDSPGLARLLHLHTTYGFFLYEKRKDAFNGRGIPYNIKDVIAFFIYKIVFGFL